MNVIAFDLSLTAPGVANDDRPSTLPATSKKKMERLSFRVRQVLDLLNEHEPRLVVLEGYAMGPTKNMAGARSNAGLGEVVRLLCFERTIPFAEVPPKTLKKYATGSGDASKQLVIEAAIAAGAQIPQRPKSGGGRESDDNAADAWWLWQMGLARYAPNDPRVRAVPALNRQSLNSVKWPKLRKAIAA